MKIIRAENTAHRAGAYYVRTQAMAVKHHIALEQEFDEHDGEDTMYLVGLDDVLPIATARMYPVDDGSVMLGRIVVLPEYRHQGLGSRMVTAAEDWARELGYKKAVLESRENKTDFYEKLGYIPNENEIVRGETFTCVHMEKIL